MSEFFGRKHQRRSLRLKNWNYAGAGGYFVTICIKNRRHFFGTIKNGKMHHSKLGKMAHEFWQAIPDHFPFVQRDAFVIMPDHMHGILWISPVGACYGTPRPLPLRAFAPPSRGSLSIIINHYKGAVTRWARSHDLENFAWQRLFYEHIIRDESSWRRIQNYILQNPLKWDLCKKII